MTDKLRLTRIRVPGIQGATGPYAKPYNVWADYGGTADLITLTSELDSIVLETGLRVRFRATAANTGATLINIDGLGSRAAKTVTGAALPAGYIRTDVDTEAVLFDEVWVVDRQPERGVGATGSWTRLADGDQTTSVSQVSNSGAVATWTFAKAFSEAPIVTASVVSSAAPRIATVSAITTSSVGFWAFNGATQVAATVNLSAIGRWYITGAGIPGYELLLLGDSTGGQQGKLTDIDGTYMTALARGYVYSYMGTRKNVYHANKPDATDYWSGATDAVSDRGWTTGAAYAIGGSHTYGSITDLFGADGVTPAELARPYTGAPLLDSRQRRIVIIGSGTNDCGEGRLATVIIAKLQLAAAYVLARGDIPVIRTILCRTDDPAFTGRDWPLNSDKRNQMGLVNISILSNTWCGPGLPIEVWDPNTDIADTGRVDAWGRHTLPIVGMLSDGLHPAPISGLILGQGSLVTTMDRIIPGDIEAWPTPVLDSGNLAYAGGLNVGMTGTDGRVFGVGVSGDVSHGWLIGRGNSYPVVSSAAYTMVGSKEAISAGLEKQVLTFTPGGSTYYELFRYDLYISGQPTTNLPLPSSITAGQYVRFLLDIDASAWNGWVGFQTTLSWVDSGGTVLYQGSAAGFNSAASDRVKQPAFSVTLVSEPTKVPVGTTQFSFSMLLPVLCAATGRATLKVSNLRFLAEADPSTVWPPG